MRKIIKIAFAFLFLGAASSAINAQQTADKKPDEKPPASTVDAWRESLPPESEQIAQPVGDESKDSAAAAETPEQIEKRILDLERQLLEAFKTRDAAALKTLLADDFVPTGAGLTDLQIDKPRFIEWTLKNLQIKSYQVEKTTARVFRTAAIVTTRFKRQAVVSNSPSSGDFIATDVWIRRNKQWQIVSHHISRTPNP